MHAYKKALPEVIGRKTYDCFYTRTWNIITALTNYNTPIILELHSVPKRLQAQFVRACNACALVACLTKAMASQLQELGVEPARLYVEPDAVDLEQYTNLPSKDTAQAALGIHTKRTVVSYIGRLKTYGDG